MILRLLSITALAIAVAATPALAAKGNKAAKGGAHSGRALARFDRDHNGVIDGAEATRLEALYATLAALDTDHNGQLSDAEVAAAKVPQGGGKRAGKGKGKKGATTPSTSNPTSTSTSTETPAK